MTRYVLGFLIDTKREKVVLIKKNRPEWQKGKFNGVGGKKREGESHIKAMTRECREETGLFIPIDGWEYFCILVKANEYTVMCYKSFADLKVLENAKTMTDEEVHVKDISVISVINCNANLKWLVPLVAYDNGFTKVVEAYY